jgi:hypothetical protein
MVSFLHKPLTDPHDIPSLVASRAHENQHRDFKATFWNDNAAKDIKAGEEAAKDIAAFANAEGGDVILGINDVGNTADGWCPQPGTRGQTGTLANMLKDYLYPPEVAGVVRIHEYALQLDGREQDAMVVNIPPWSGGVVGVKVNRTKGHRDNSCYFPLRLQDKTINLTMDEAIMRSNASHRSSYLRALDIYRRDQGTKVTFASMVAVETRAARNFTCSRRRRISSGSPSQHKKAWSSSASEARIRPNS